MGVGYDVADVDVLLMTGIRDEAPVAALAHLVPESRLLDVQVRRKKRINDLVKTAALLPIEVEVD